MLDNHEDDEERPQKKKRKLSQSQDNNNNNNQDLSFIKVPAVHKMLSKIFHISFKVGCYFWVYYYVVLFLFPESFGFVYWINQPTSGWNWIKATGLGCHMQSSWTQTWQHVSLFQESNPGSYGCRITTGCYSDLEQSAMVWLTYFNHLVNRINFWISCFNRFKHY